MAPLLTLQISCNGKTRRVPLYNQAIQIGTLKTMIAPKVGVHPQRLELYFGGEQLVNHQTIQDYGIVHNSMIDVEIRYRLLVSPLDSGYIVEVHDRMSIGEVRGLLGTESGLDFTNKQLRVGLPPNRVVLGDDTALVEQCGIKEGSHVTFIDESDESDESDD